MEEEEEEEGRAGTEGWTWAMSEARCTPSRTAATAAAATGAASGTPSGCATQHPCTPYPKILNLPPRPWAVDTFRVCRLTP